MTFLPMIVIFVVFYFLLIRPQMKKREGSARRCSRRCRRATRSSPPAASSARIAKLGDSTSTVEIAPNTEISVQRGAISQLLPKGTIKA